MSPPLNYDLRNFYFDYDVILHQVASHQILVNIKEDWQQGLVSEDSTLQQIGVIALDTQTGKIPVFQVSLQEGSVWQGFKNMVVLGIDHIAEGTDHILFIASGAFHVAKPSDLIPELQGRFPIRVEMDSLTESDFYDILTIPQNALTKQYEAMLRSEGVELSFTDDAIKEIARIAAEVNSAIENIGARRLHTILTSVLEELLFIVPDDIQGGKVVIDMNYVNKQISNIVKNPDLSHFIL
jgi:hypothetical protein